MNSSFISSLSFPVLIWLSTGMVCLGCFFLIFRLVKRHWVRRGVSSGIGSGIGPLLILLLSWPTLGLGLVSFASVGIASCQVGFYQPAPVSPAATLSLTTPKNRIVLNAYNGSVQQMHSWEIRTDIILSDPAESNGVVYMWYLANRQLHIQAFRQDTGTALWDTPLNELSASSPAGSLPKLATSFAFADGLVYVAAYGDGYNHTRPSSLTIFALRVSDGGVAWTVHINGPAHDYGQTFQMIAVPGLVILVNQDGSLTALHTSDGSQVWHLDSKTVAGNATATGSQGVDAQVAFIEKQTVYIAQTVSQAFSSQLTAFRINDGQRLWQHIFPGQTTVVSIFRAGANLYAGLNNSLYAFNSTTGAALWQSAGIKAEAGVVSSGVLYVSGVNGSAVVAALQSENGRELWHHGFTTFQVEAPILSGNVLFVSLGYGAGHIFFGNICPGRPEGVQVGVYALNASDGSIYWRTPTIASGLLSLI